MSPDAVSATKIYIVSAEAETGKSAVALGVLSLLTATGGRVGVFRPISRAAHNERDYLLELLLEHTSADISYDDAIGVTYDALHDDEQAALGTILQRRDAVAQNADVVLDCVAVASTVATAVEVAGRGGTVVVVGVPAGDVTVPLIDSTDVLARRTVEVASNNVAHIA